MIARSATEVASRSDPLLDALEAWGRDQALESRPDRATHVPNRNSNRMANDHLLHTGDLSVSSRPQGQQQPRLVHREQVRATRKTLRQPFLQLIADLQAPLAKISPHFRGRSAQAGRIHVPHLSRYALRQRQDAVQDLVRRAPLPRALAPGRSAVVLHALPAGRLFLSAAASGIRSRRRSSAFATSSSTTRRPGRRPRVRRHSPRISRSAATA